jgi:hypothetical protein
LPVPRQDIIQTVKSTPVMTTTVEDNMEIGWGYSLILICSEVTPSSFVLRPQMGLHEGYRTLKKDLYETMVE